MFENIVFGVLIFFYKTTAIEDKKVSEEKRSKCLYKLYTYVFYGNLQAKVT